MDNIIEIGGKQTFTADFVFQQMQAQGRRVDRARWIAVLALAVAALSAAIAVATAVLR